MNLSKLLIEKNKEIDQETRKQVNQFLKDEMDIERLKKCVISYFTDYISKIVVGCELIQGDFVLHLKKGAKATLYKDNKAFNQYIARDITSILNLDGLGMFRLYNLRVLHYDCFYQDIEIVFSLCLINEDF